MVRIKEINGPQPGEQQQLFASLEGKQGPKAWKSPGPLKLAEPVEAHRLLNTLPIMYTRPTEAWQAHWSQLGLPKFAGTIEVHGAHQSHGAH